METELMAGATSPEVHQLTDTERSMLELERLWWKFPGAKEDFIRVRFGISPTRYYSALNALIRRPEAMAYDAITVKKLLRLAERRRGHRSPIGAR